MKKPARGIKRIIVSGKDVSFFTPIVYDDLTLISLAFYLDSWLLPKSVRSGAFSKRSFTQPNDPWFLCGIAQSGWDVGPEGVLGCFRC